MPACLLRRHLDNDGQSGTAQANHPGTSIEGIVSAGVSLVQRFHVNARYRGGHPRAYFPGMTHSYMASQQQWSAAAATAANTSLTSFLASIVGFITGTTNVGQQVAVSYHQNKALRPVPLVLPVISWTVNTSIGSQRRRLHQGQ